MPQRAMGVEPPCPGNQDHASNHAAPADGTDTRWRPTEAVTHIEQKQKADVCGEGIAPDPVARTRCEHIQPNPYRKHSNLDHHRSDDRVPQSEPEAGPSGIEQHVGPVRDPVENPVADHPIHTAIAPRQ